MLLDIPDVLSQDQVRHCRALLEGAGWQDGRATAGHQAQRVKSNQQLAPDDPVAARVAEVVMQALGTHPVFMSAALPLKVLPPRFNRYADGGAYRNHVDSAILSVPGSGHRIRSDVSATLFFSEPDEYDGGELVVEDTYGTQRIKLRAGHLALYPGTSLHRVEPVTRGARIASFFWVQSLVREDAQRAMLYELDGAIQSLLARDPDSAEVPRLLGIYHNLLRRWSET